MISAEQQEPRVQKEREEWRRKTADIDPRCLKFLDQTNAKTTMTRLFGRALRGQRIREYVPDGRWKSMTLMGTLGYAGDTTALTYEGGTDVTIMLMYIEKILAPVLRRGHILVLDRLASHLEPTVVSAVEKTGAKIWHLPPYSHDFNPIEQMWSKVKAHLRKAKARDTPCLNTAIADALDSVTASDAVNWFAHCGYPHTKT